jgi:peroxiredoxin Q/BCP
MLISRSLILASVLIGAALGSETYAAQPENTQSSKTNAGEAMGHTGATIGSQAPNFTLPTNDGKQVTLSEYRGKSVVVLFFYPKDGTAICTKEACLFRDSFETFAEQGATVLGISSDSTDAHEKFARANALPFMLLSDKDGAIRKQFGVKPTMGVIPGRVTFVIEKNGVIRHSFESQLDAQKHVDEALAWVKKLQAEPASQ